MLINRIAWWIILTKNLIERLNDYLNDYPSENRNHYGRQLWSRATVADTSKQKQRLDRTRRRTAAVEGRYSDLLQSCQILLVISIVETASPGPALRRYRCGVHSFILVGASWFETPAVACRECYAIYFPRCEFAEFRQRGPRLKFILKIKITSPQAFSSIIIFENLNNKLSFTVVYYLLPTKITKFYYF